MARPLKVRVVLSLDVDWETFADLNSTKWYGYASQAAFREAVREYVAEQVKASAATKQGAIRRVRRG